MEEGIKKGNCEMSAEGTEARVCADIIERQRAGIKKYGTSVRENPLALREWLNHAYQELLDGAIYLRRAMEIMDGGEIVDVVLQAEPDTRPPMVWRHFLKLVGVSVQTGWRWRKLGWITTIEIAGKPYVAQAEVERFNARMAAGEFSGMRAIGLVKKGGKA